jgi:hypothetical protein
MTCAKTRALLPLYVGSDLGPAKMRAVFEHIRACPQCAVAEAELDASRRMLRRYDPPDFEDDFYDGIRRAVLAKIGAPPPRAHGVLAMLAGRRRRFVLATAAAVLVSSMTVTVTRRAPHAEPALQASTVAEDRGEAAPPEPDLEAPTVAERPRTRPKRKPGPRRTSPVARAATPVSPPWTETPFENASDPALATSVDEPAPETQKIEMHTSDPNIRIIWFAPKQEGAGLGKS